MSRLRVTITRFDEESNSSSEIASFDLPQQEIDPMQLTETLDRLEQQTIDIGNPILQKIMEAQWEETDIKLTQKARQAFSPSKGEKGRMQTS